MPMTGCNTIFDQLAVAYFLGATLYIRAPLAAGRINNFICKTNYSNGNDRVKKVLYALRKSTRRASHR